MAGNVFFASHLSPLRRSLVAIGLFVGIASPATAQVVCSPVPGTACGAKGGAGGPDRASAGGEGNGQGGGAQDISQGRIPVDGLPAIDGKGGDGATGFDIDGSIGGAGGAGGDLGTLIGTAVTGGAGADGSPHGHIPGGGGGGGAGALTSALNFSTTDGNSYTGGAGGKGGAPEDGSGGSGGGGGGAGLILGGGGNQHLTVTGGSPITGGAGGNGGEFLGGNTTWGGGGGGGGDGVLVLGGNAAVSIDAGGIVVGGTGGAGGYGGFVEGEDGDSGAGIRAMGIGLNVDNHGTIRGGNGTGGGAAGVGIITQGTANITNYGTLSGGTDTNGRASSVLFNGTNNTLNLQSGSTVIGVVEVGAGASATIAPSGTTTIDGAKLDGSGALLIIDLTSASLDMGSSIAGTGDVSSSGAEMLTLHGVDLTGSLDFGNSGGVVTSGGAIRTSGLQRYAGPVQVGADTTFSSIGGSITFDQSINGTHALEVDASTGNVYFGNTLGGVQALSSVTVNSNTLSIGGVSAGLLDLDVSTGITQSGAFSISGASIFQTIGDLALTNVGNTFGGALHIQAANVTVATSGDLNVSSLSAAPGGDITLTSGGVLTLPTSGLSTLGTITLKGIFASGNLSAQSIDLDGTGALIVDGAVMATNGLTLHATGNVSQTAGGITANTISVDAGSNDVLLNQAGNAIDTVEDVSARALSIANSTALTFAGIVHVDTLNLNMASASITGSITADAVANLPGGTTLTVGNGGAVGTLQADVVDHGTLAFDRSDAVSFAGALGGDGALVQRGSGSLVFDGDGSAFQGQTRVEAGELVVGSTAGSGAKLAGNITVADGATLGGHGSVGNTTVLAGGTLAPGASMGTLTVDGNLTMAQGTALDFEFGAPGLNFATPGQSDHVVVTGNLSIGRSTLNVNNLGSMGPGLYNLFTWGGALDIAGGGFTPPPGTSLQILTVDKQINLIDTQGLTLNLWNANGLAGPGQMGGGSGVWSLFSRSWSDTTGQYVGPMSPQPGFAIFAGVAGTVTVDDSFGTVGVTGMQFASDGYHLTGDAIDLVGQNGGTPVLRVDNGATAIIDNVLNGNSAFNKTDGGRLVLTGANLYTGGTILSGGELSVSSDANLGAASGALDFEGGVLQVTGNNYHSTARQIMWGNVGGGFDIAAADNTFTVSQSLTGPGGLIKLGAGILNLSGVNGYTGGTTVSEGTITTATTGALGSGPVVIAANSGSSASIVFTDSADASSLSFDVTGTNSRLYFYDDSTAGNATIANRSGKTRFYDNSTAGNASLINEDANSAFDFSATSGPAGDHKVSAGSLSGDGIFALGSNELTVGGNGLSTTVSGAIKDGGDEGGTGASLVKTGTGMLTLTGDNSYTGGTTVTTGTLQIGDGGASGSIAGDVKIASAGTFAFNRSDDYAFTGALSGDGHFTKAGAGILAYDGNGSNFAGMTEFVAGSLIVGSDAAHADAVLGGSVNVGSGGTLGGHGTIGSGAGSVLTIGSGATIAPGNSIGTLTVNGNYVQVAGSTYLAEITPGGSSDRIAVTGTATISGGTVFAAKAPGGYRPGTQYTILSADGGVSGTYAILDQNAPFVDLALTYDANNIVLDVVRNDVSFPTVGQTPNQKATAAGLESLGEDSLLYNVIAGASDEATARADFDSLSGEIHASIKSALIDDSHFVRDAVNTRVRSAFGDATGAIMPVVGYGPDGVQATSADSIGLVGWGYAFGSWGSFDDDGNAASMDTATGGFLTGIDGEIAQNVRLGLLAGYSRTTFDIHDRASSGNSDDYHLGLYGSGKWDALRLTGGIAYTWHDIETSRSVAIPGFVDSLDGDYTAGTLQIFGEAGYRIDGPHVSFEPFANLAYVRLHTDSFTEHGGAAAFHVEGEIADTTFATLGVHLSSTFELGGMLAHANGTLGWRHAFGDTTPESIHAFAGGDAFTIAGVPISKDAALIEAGLDMDITSSATLGLAYQGQFGNGTTQNGFKANLSVKF